MVSSNQGKGRQPWSPGRSFTSADPERQREVVGYVYGGPIDTAPASRSGDRYARTARTDWMQVQADRDNGSFEGSSSRRSR